MVTKLNDMLPGYFKVMYWFFDYPDVPITLSELASRLKISKVTAYRAVISLIKEGFLIKEQIGRAWRITCNLSHPYNTTRKVPYHLQLIYESGIIDAINEAYPDNLAIILFGSYRRGDDVHNSDLDIAVEVPKLGSVKHIEFTKMDLGFRKNVPVHLLIFSRESIDANLFANIANGIVLEGFLEVKP